MNIDYSIVIPAYNEVSFLPETIAAVKAAMRENSLVGEIVVCNNNSTDATAALAEELGAKVVFEPYNQISRARNTGARHAKGKYLIFVDADTRISAGLLNDALHRLQSGQCCGGGSVVEIDEGLTPAVRRIINGWTRLSVKYRLAAGCFVFCLREDFEAVGGFSESVYASEEIWFSRAVHRLGKKRNQPFCIITDYPVLSSGRKMTWFSVPKQSAVLVMLLLFPFLLRYRCFCGFWYNRPDK
jgi:glycosyltransferase involved in cell wall biosynthesis